LDLVARLISDSLKLHFCFRYSLCCMET